MPEGTWCSVRTPRLLQRNRFNDQHLGRARLGRGRSTREMRARLDPANPEPTMTTCMRDSGRVDPDYRYR